MSSPVPAGRISDDGCALITSRLIAAPRERVFGAFSDPALLARWWGPTGFTNTFSAFDLRPGGLWRLVMHGPDGSDYPNESVFTDVSAPERLVFRHVSAPEFEMTLGFTNEGAGTRIDWQQRFADAELCQRIARYALAANEQNLDRLTAVLLASA